MSATDTRSANHATAGSLPSTFHQMAWVVRDLERAERFFVEKVGVSRFFRMTGVRAQDLNGTYRGRPGDWVADLLIGYHGDLQVELIGNLTGESIFSEFLSRSAGGLQHVAYIVDDDDAARAYLQASGYPLVQSFEPPGARIGYHDTTDAIGAMTETIWLDDEGRALFGRIKRGDF